MLIKIVNIKLTTIDTSMWEREKDGLQQAVSS